MNDTSCRLHDESCTEVARSGALGAAMRAVTVSQFGIPPVVRDDLPEPTAGPGQVLVRVRASSVNWLDADMVHGMFTETMPHKLPITLGRDFAGIVEAVGHGV